MSKRSFGISQTVSPETRIYYENIFSQFQAGRVSDLLAALANETGADGEPFRASINAALMEACRFHGLFNSAIASLEPVSIEYGSEENQYTISVGFTVAEEYWSEFQALQSHSSEDLNALSTSANSVNIRYHAETKRAEILYSLNPTEKKETPTQAEFTELVGDLEEIITEHEYVDLGDVAYQKLLPENPNAPEANPVRNSKRIIAAATAAETKAEAELSGEMDKLLANGHSKEQVVEALANSSGVEQMSETIKRNLKTEEISRMITQGDPAKVAEILADRVPEPQMVQSLADMSNEEKAALAASADPGEAGKILFESLQPDEIRKLLAENLGVQEKARVLANYAPEKTAELLQKNIPEAELAKLLAEQLTEEEQAKILANGNEKFAAKIVKQLHSEEEVSRLIREALPEKEQGKILSKGLEEDEVVQFLSSSIPENDRIKVLGKANPEAVSKLIKGSIPEAELAQAIRGGLPDADIATIVKAGSTQKELEEIVKIGADKNLLAEKILKGSKPAEAAALIRKAVSEKDIQNSIAQMPKEEIARIAGNAMAPEELFRFVSKTMAAEEISRTITGSLTPELIEKIIIPAMKDPRISKEILARIPPDQLASQIKDNLPKQMISQAALKHMSEKEIIETLSIGLPKKDFAKILSAALPKETYAQALAQGMPPEEIGRTLSEASAPRPQPKLEPAQISTLLKPGLTKEQAVETISKVLPKKAAEIILEGALSKEEVTKTLQSYLPTPEMASAVATSIAKIAPVKTSPKATPQQSENALEYYKARAQKLENLLQKAEDTTTKAQAESEKSRTELAKFLDDKPVENVPEVAKAEETTKPAIDPRTEMAMRRSRDAARFFQKKAKDLEAELRRSESEIKKLNAEHTKDLLKASMTARPEQIKRLEKDIQRLQEENWKLAQRETLSSLDSEVEPSDDAATELNAIESDNAERMEKSSEELDQDLEGIAKKVEVIKESTNDTATKRVADGVLTLLLTEKAKLASLSKELTVSIRRKEFDLKNREAVLMKELRQLKSDVNQKQANTDRLKQQLLELQYKFEREKGQMAQNSESESQLRVKFSQAQGQIETLHRELEKANKRIQNHQAQATSSASPAAQLREVTELKKQLETSAKVIASKRHEHEVLRKQLVERDAREAELKKAILKLQHELTAAKTTKKAS